MLSRAFPCPKQAAASTKTMIRSNVFRMANNLNVRAAFGQSVAATNRETSRTWKEDLKHLEWTEPDLQIGLTDDSTLPCYAPAFLILCGYWPVSTTDDASAGCPLGHPAGKEDREERAVEAHARLAAIYCHRPQECAAT